MDPVLTPDQQSEFDLLEKKRQQMLNPDGTAAESKKAAKAAQKQADTDAVLADTSALLGRYDLLADPEGAKHRLATDHMTPLRAGASDLEYIPDGLAEQWQKAISEAQDPVDMADRLKGSWYLSRLTGVSFDQAFAEHDEVMRGWRDEALQPRDWAEAVQNTWNAAWISNDIAKSAYALWNKGYSGADVEKDPLYQHILDLEQQLPPTDLQAASRWLPTKAVKGLFQFLPSLFESMGAGAKGGAVMGAAAGLAGAASGLAGATSALGGAVGAGASVAAGGYILPAIVLAGFALGSSAGGALKSRELETGSTYYDLLRYRDPVSGARINPQVALQWSGIYGGIAAATESLQMDSLFKAFPGLGDSAKKAITKAVEDTLEDRGEAAARSGILQRAMARVVGSAATDMGKRLQDIASETAQEVLQQGFQSAAEAIARSVTAKVDHTYVSPMTMNEVGDALVDTLVSSAMGFSAAHVLPATAHLFMDGTAAGVVAHKTAKVLSAEERPEAATDIKPADMEMFRARVQEPTPEGLHLQAVEEIEGEQYAMKAAVGDKRVGTLRYSIEANDEGGEGAAPGTVHLLGLEKGTAPNIGAALVRSVAYRFPGWDIEWEPLSPTQAALKQYLTETNPRGTAAGLQAFYAPRDIPGQVTSEYLKARIKDVAPGWSDQEVDFGARVMAMWGRKLGMTGDQMADASLSPEVFGSVMSQAAVAQGATGATMQVRVGDTFKSLVQMAPTANASTAMHEFTHAVVLYARGAAQTSPQAQAFLLELESAMGVKDGNWDGEWSGWTGEYKGGNRSAMEALTYGLEDYFATGKAPKPELQSLFAKVAQWVLDIYKGMKGARVEMSPAMTSYFDDLVGGEGSPFREDATRQTEADLAMQRQEGEAAPRMAAAMGEKGTVPEDAFPLYQAGPAKEAAAAQSDLDLAKEMADSGASPVAIKAATGWAKEDGEWARDTSRAPTPQALTPEAQGAVAEAKVEQTPHETTAGAALAQDKAYSEGSHEDLEPIQRAPQGEGVLYQGDMAQRDEALDQVMIALEAQALPYEVERSRRSGSLYVQLKKGGQQFTIRLSDHPSPRQAIAHYGAPDYEIDYTKPLDATALQKFIEAPAHKRVFYQGGLHSLEDKNLMSPAIYYSLSGLNHGAKAGFDRFDHSFMGTGEGQQVYGWGTYLTENRDVAKRQYADRLGEGVSLYFPGAFPSYEDTASNEVRGIIAAVKLAVTKGGPSFPTSGPEMVERLRPIIEAAYQDQLDKAEYADTIDGGTRAKDLRAWRESIDNWDKAEIRGGHWLYKTDVETRPAPKAEPIVLGKASLADGSAEIEGPNGRLTTAVAPQWAIDILLKDRALKYKKYAIPDLASDETDQAKIEAHSKKVSAALQAAVEQALKDSEGYPASPHINNIYSFLADPEGNIKAKIVPANAPAKVMLSVDRLADGTADLYCTTGALEPSMVKDAADSIFMDWDEAQIPEEKDYRYVLASLKGYIASEIIPSVASTSVKAWVDADGIFDPSTMPADLKAHSDAMTAGAIEYLEEWAKGNDSPKINNAIDGVLAYISGPEEDSHLFLIGNSQTPEVGADTQDGRWLRWDKPTQTTDIKAIRDAAAEVATAGKSGDMEALRGFFGDLMDDKDFKGGLKSRLNALEMITSMAEPGKTGEEWYGAIAGGLGSPKAASRFLYAAGFDGNKYPVAFLTGGSGDKGFNYVVFNDGALSIKQRVLYQGEFGKEWAVPEHETQRAIDTLMSIREGVIEKAAYREGVGEIAIPWGREGDAGRGFSGGFGLSKIVGKHEAEGEDVVKHLAAVLERGAVYTDPAPGHEARVIFALDGYRAVVSMTREFNGKREPGPWLVTAYKDRINSANGREAAPAGAQIISPAVPQAEGGALPSGSGASSTVPRRRLVVKAKKLYQAEAYHGSAANIEDGFSTDHIGEGEGAQAYGWGLYFTSNEEIARWYAHKLTAAGAEQATLTGIQKRGWPRVVQEAYDSARHPRTQAGSVLSADEFSTSLQESRGLYQADIDRATAKGDQITVEDYSKRVVAIDEAIQAIKDGEFTEENSPEGRRNLYKVAINKGKDDVWLDWNQPLAGQSPEAQASLLKAGYYVPKQEELDAAYSEAEAQLADEEADGREDEPGEPEVEIRHNEDDGTWEYYLDGESAGWADSEEAAQKEAQAAAEKAGKAAQDNWYSDIRQSLSTDDIEERMREVISHAHDGAMVVNPDMEGSDLYKLVVRNEGGSSNPWMGDPEAPRNASLDLLDAGFTGIRYPAASMGAGTGEAGTNFVVFDDKLLQIEEHILYQNGRPLREAIPAGQVALYQGNDGDDPGVDALKGIARESAERGEGWEDFMAFCEAMFTDKEREDWQMPPDLPPDQKRAWYKTMFEEAQVEPSQDEALAAWIASLARNDHEKLGAFLQKIWTDVLVAENRDIPPGADEEEARQWSEGKDRAREIKGQLAEPIVAAAAHVGTKGAYLMPQMRAALMGIIKANPEEYAALYGELMGDKRIQALGNEATAKKFEGIEIPAKQKAMTISQRNALAEQIRDEQLARQVRTGQIVVGDDVKGMIERNRAALKESKATIATLEGEAKAAGIDLDEQGKTLVEAQGKYQETKREIAKLLARLDSYTAEGEPVPSVLESRRATLEKQQAALRKKLQGAGDWMTLQEDLDQLKEEATRTDRTIQQASAAGYPTDRAMLQKRSEQQAQIRSLEAKLSAAKEYKNAAQLQTYLAKTEAIAKERDTVQRAQAEGKALKKITAYRDKLEKAIMKPTSGAINVAYSKQIHAIQAAIDPEHPTERTKERVAELREELEKNPALAREIPKQWLRRALGKSTGEMSLVELEETAKRVNDLRTEGRAIQAQIDRDRADENMEAQIRIAEAVMGRKSYQEPNGYEPEKSFITKLKGKVRTFDYGFLSMMRFSKMLDDDTEGFNFETLWTEMNRHYREEMEQKTRRVTRILDAFKAAGVSPDDWYNTQVEVPGCGPGRTDKTLRKSDLLALEMAFKNEDSRQAALFGDFFSTKEKKSMDEEELLFEGVERFAALRAAIDKVLTDKDQQVLDVLAQDAAETAPRLTETVARTENREMPTVEDYFPMIRELVSGVPLDAQLVDEMGSRTTGNRKPPKNGFTKERINISPKMQGPIKLDLLGTWLESISRQEHYLATAEYGKKLDAFYLAPYVQEQIRGAMGDEGATYVKEYIAEVKNPGALQDKTKWENSIRYLRGNLGAAYLGFKTSSVIKQLVTSPWPTLPYAGPRLFAEAAKCLANPVGFLRETEALSTYLTNRTCDLSLEAIKEAKASGAVAKALLGAEKVGVKGLELADRFSVAIGWRAVYERALEEFSGDTTKAEEKADQAVMMSQPSSRVVDLSPIYRNKSEGAKAILQFTQALNVIWQNIRYDLPAALKAHQFKTAIGIGVSYAIAGVLLNAVTNGWGKGDDTPEKKAKKLLFWSLTQGTDSIPLIGQDATRALQMWVTGEKSAAMPETALPAIAELMDGMYRLGGGDIDKAVQRFARGGGMVLGAPVSGIKEAGRVVHGDFGALIARPVEGD